MGRVGPDYAAEIRRTLTDPGRMCERLGLSQGAQRQASGWIVRCPAHDDRNPSCSVTRGPDGTIRARCFSCGWTGDALTLVAAVHGMDIKNRFRDVMVEAASIAGLHAIVDELRNGKAYEPRPLPVAPPAEPDRDYPDLSQVESLWNASGPLDEDEDSKWLLEGRGIDPRAAARMGLGRALGSGVGASTLPSWARYRGSEWPALGFRIVVPVFDASGTMRSVRAWRVKAGDGPKRLPPAGHRASGLVMANRVALDMLASDRGSPCRVVVAEGEPDFFSWSLKAPWMPVLGIVSGSWSQDFADRIPYGSELIVRTHHDDAGERYAAEIVKTTRDRAVVRRSADAA